MRRSNLGNATIALPVFALTLFLAGCGKDEKKDTPPKDAGSQTEAPKPAGPAKELKSANGVLKGKIEFKGSQDLAAADIDFKKIIEAKGDTKDVCLAGTPSELAQQAYRVNDKKLLGNVFVWIAPESGDVFKVDEKRLEEAKKNAVVISQPHCAFIPHSAILFAEYHPDAKKPKDAKKTGQVIKIVNDSPGSHNTNYEAGPRNPKGDPTLPPGKDLTIENLKTDSTPMKLKCGIHPWMDAYILLLDTPYYAISHSDTLDGADKVKKDDAKFGTFEIKNLPVGKVRVFAWHEKAGWLNKNAGKGEVIDIKDGTNEKNFEAK